MSRYTNNSNPFDDEDDGFVHVPPSQRGDHGFEERRSQLSRMADESEERQLESTQRAIASLYESEAMGNATAEELLRQREVIGNITKKTDDINTTLTTSQRHINNIRSVFGGIKNWWTTKKEASEESANRKSASSLDSIVKRNQDTAATTSSSTDTWGGGAFGADKGGAYGADSGGAYGADRDLDSRFMGSSSSATRSRGSESGASSLQYVQPITRSAREEDLDRNLGMMSDGLGRLKVLAQGLGDEIEYQNEALDQLNPKVNKANDLLESQNRQMGKILKR